MNIFSLLLGKQYNVLTYLPEAVLVIDETGKIHYANKRAFKLFETNKLRGKNINEYFIINSDNIISNKDEEIKQILKIVSEEQNTKITDVKVTDVSSGKKKRYILTIIDNTQDHSLLDQLITERQEQKILNHTKNVLLTKMSNYLCSPLHSIVGFSQAMLEGLSGEMNEKQTKYLQIMNSNSSELLLFLEKLIELSQVEADIYKFDYNNFDAAALLSVVTNELNVKLQNKDIKVTVNTSDLVKQNCYSDKNVLKTVMSNLLSNALELIETGAISINLSNPIPEFLLAKGFEVGSNVNEKSYLMFEVACKGLEATLYNNEDIFDPYVQVEKNSKKYLLQSFLLGSTKKYINKLKGEIWINNQYANQVSFVFIVPIEKSLIEEIQA
ncbi:TPA: PAS domain-containing protein [Candidatus Avigastranaerophilus faecigallinarum]|nr:PAS domain-containing protein [Candidatus Avigastranaerophilus faecigallinarum]